MFKTLRNAFKVKDIRNRLIFTFFMLIIIRIGSELPAPGIDGEVFKQWWQSQATDGLGFFNAITGGSFLNMSVFALRISSLKEEPISSMRWRKVSADGMALVIPSASL